MGDKRAWSGSEPAPLFNYIERGCKGKRLEAKFSINERNHRLSLAFLRTRGQAIPRRFRRSGFGVTITGFVSIIALLRMTEAVLQIMRLKDTACSVGVGDAKNDFFVAGLLLTFALIGYGIARESNYGVGVARSACIISAMTWLSLSYFVIL